MSEIKSRADLFEARADLFEAAAKMMRMCDEAGTRQCFKFDGELKYVNEFRPSYDSPRFSAYEFPLAVVEGKPVFKGDELYSTRTGVKYIAGVDRCDFTVDWSWLPPKPRTVMVELLREDAEWWDKEVFCSDRQVRVQAACRKALDEK